jgi:hypothetical protein
VGCRDRRQLRVWDLATRQRVWLAKPHVLHLISNGCVAGSGPRRRAGRSGLPGVGGRKVVGPRYAAERFGWPRLVFYFTCIDKQ